MVQEALSRLMEDTTTIPIAHRFATVLRAKKIYVIEKGGVVESGRHDELLRKGHSYAHLYHLQFEEHPERAEGL